jgi:hypothetical protein
MYKYRETTKDTNYDDFSSLRRFRFGTWTISGHFSFLAGRTDRSPNSRKIYHWWMPCGNRDICIRSRRKRKTKDIRNTGAKRQNSRRQWWISSDQHALSLIVYLDGPPSAIPVSLLSAASAGSLPTNFQSAARTAEFTRNNIMKFYSHYSCANVSPHAIIP